MSLYEEQNGGSSPVMVSEADGEAVVLCGRTTRWSVRTQASLFKPTPLAMETDADF